MAQETVTPRGDDLGIFDPSPAHAALRADLQDLEAIAKSTAPEAIEQLRIRLAEVHEHVLLHFSSEENGGWFDHIKRDQPRLSKAVQALVDEHVQLRAALQAMEIASRSASGIDVCIGERVKAFVAAMRQHESREDDLIQEAYNRDIGAAD